MLLFLFLWKKNDVTHNSGQRQHMTGSTATKTPISSLTASLLDDIIGVNKYSNEETMSVYTTGIRDSTSPLLLESLSASTSHFVIHSRIIILHPSSQPPTHSLPRSPCSESAARPQRGNLQGCGLSFPKVQAPEKTSWPRLTRPSRNTF